MFTAYLNDQKAWEAVLTNQVLRTSLDWLIKNTPSVDLGDYPIGGAGWYANVHTYTTLQKLESIWESHTSTVDVQYIISGEEVIHWLPVSSLGDPLRSLADCDRVEWRWPTQATTELVMREGMFAIFLPGEGHCPMIALESSMKIRKAVVKIPCELLLTESA